MPGKSRRNWLETFGMASSDDKSKAQRSALKPDPKRRSARETIRTRHFPNVVLTTHEGKKVNFYDDLIKDKIVVINMMYADCEGVCPTITANLGKVQKKLGARVGRDIFIYSITLKPESDTPKVLHHYAKMHGAKPGWTFLTGSPNDIEILRRGLGFVDPDPELDRDKSTHIGNLKYGSEPLMLWAACPGQADVDWIVESILWMDRPNASKAGKGEAR